MNTVITRVLGATALSHTKAAVLFFTHCCFCTSRANVYSVERASNTFVSL